MPRACHLWRLRPTRHQATRQTTIHGMKALRTRRFRLRSPALPAAVRRDTTRSLRAAAQRCDCKPKRPLPVFENRVPSGRATRTYRHRRERPDGTRPDADLPRIGFRLTLVSPLDFRITHFDGPSSLAIRPVPVNRLANPFAQLASSREAEQVFSPVHIEPATGLAIGL